MTEWLEDEALMDAVTAISGSGPAYFFLLMEMLEESGSRPGSAPGQGPAAHPGDGHRRGAHGPGER
ncbi:MAG: pyrroline-5-carboxylate reductase dimerization domain-containing protein [Arhodomonas sp.]|nr:pyrroline-5-carboxylate reductase dimerization domain-containing protein [Arhodomonas sp.]